MILKDEKVYLRKDLVEENFPLLLRWFGDLEVMKYVGWVKKGLALRFSDAPACFRASAA